MSDKKLDGKRITIRLSKFMEERLPEKDLSNLSNDHPRNPLSL